MVVWIVDARNVQKGFSQMGLSSHSKHAAPSFLLKASKAERGETLMWRAQDIYKRTSRMLLSIRPSGKACMAFDEKFHINLYFTVYILIFPLCNYLKKISDSP